MIWKLICNLQHNNTKMLNKNIFLRILFGYHKHFRELMTVFLFLSSIQRKNAVPVCTFFFWHNKLLFTVTTNSIQMLLSLLVFQCNYFVALKRYLWSFLSNCHHDNTLDTYKNGEKSPQQLMCVFNKTSCILFQFSGDL